MLYKRVTNPHMHCKSLNGTEGPTDLPKAWWSMLIGSFYRYAQIYGTWLTVHGKACNKYGLLIWMEFQEQVLGWIRRTCDRISHCHPTTKRKTSGRETSCKYLQPSYKTIKKNPQTCWHGFNWHAIGSGIDGIFTLHGHELGQAHNHLRCWLVLEFFTRRMELNMHYSCEKT